LKKTGTSILIICREAAMATVFLFCFTNVDAQTPKPNIIYIMADDLGYADLSSYGRKDYQTPNIDKLAAGGMNFLNAYSATPPTRTAFITGKYPAHTPVGLREPLDWTHNDSTVGLTPEYPSMASALQKAGYETWLVGKWHLGFSPEFSPMKNGFDYFYGHHGGGVDYISHWSPDKDNDLYENDRPIEKEGYLTNILSDKAIELIRQKHNKPFFLAMMFNAPHWPWQSPGDPPYPDTMGWKKGGAPKTYGMMMKSLDDAVGSIMQVLKDQHLDKNTLVIFTSDNGGEQFSDMGPYKGRKMTLWEGGIRVPAMMNWPGKIKAGTTSLQPVITMDWTATILVLAGAKLAGNLQVDGMDMMRTATGRNVIQSRTFYWRLFQRIEQKAMRDSDWKYVKDEKGNEFLFDLSKDPSEKNNLNETNAEVFEKLKKKYHNWESKMLTPVPLN
jgi:arylsulfatase A-like enzyme